MFIFTFDSSPACEVLHDFVLHSELLIYEECPSLWVVNNVLLLNHLVNVNQLSPGVGLGFLVQNLHNENYFID